MTKNNPTEKPIKKEGDSATESTSSTLNLQHQIMFIEEETDSDLEEFLGETTDTDTAFEESEELEDQVVEKLKQLSNDEFVDLYFFVVGDFYPEWKFGRTDMDYSSLGIPGKTFKKRDEFLTNLPVEDRIDLIKKIPGLKAKKLDSMGLQRRIPLMRRSMYTTIINSIKDLPGIKPLPQLSEQEQKFISQIDQAHQIILGGYKKKIINILQGKDKITPLIEYYKRLTKTFTQNGYSPDEIKILLKKVSYDAIESPGVADNNTETITQALNQI